MRRVLCASVLTVFVLFGTSNAYGAVFDLFDFGMYLDGTTYCDIGPCDSDTLTDLSGVPGVDDSLFDFSTGIGTLSVTTTGAGAHSVDFFVDIEIDEVVNSFFNESGAASGVSAAGQSWEIDEPGFVFGDLFDNFLVSSLDGSNGVPAGSEDDVSMALGWDFVLGAGETSDIVFLLSTVMPTSGFFLSHTDADFPSEWRDCLLLQHPRCSLSPGA